jgi:hypothetical protein
MCEPDQAVAAWFALVGLTYGYWILDANWRRVIVYVYSREVIQ